MILKNAKLGTCATVSKVQQSTRSFMNEDSMQKLVKQTSAGMDVKGSYKTLELSVTGTVSALTGSSSSETSTFHSTHLDITSVTSVVDLQQSEACIGIEQNVEEHFLATFKAIPLIDADAVSSSASWAPYVNFLHDQGSHIMIQQKIGSRLQQWESTTSEMKDVAQTLQTKACANVEGIAGAGGWSVSTCAAYNNSQKEEAIRAQSQSVRVVLGGTAESRTGITQSLNEETLKKFIADAEKGDQPIDFSFKPIWEVLLSYYGTRCASLGRSSEDCKHRQRAYNLQAAFEGWLAVGCPRLVTTNNVVYQQMAILDATPDATTYQCKQAKTGCNTDDDCYIGGAGSVCYCYGPSCLDAGDKISGTNDFRTVVRGSESGSYNRGVNNACYYKVGVYCNCDKTWSGGLQERGVYQQGSYAEDSLSMSELAGSLIV